MIFECPSLLQIGHFNAPPHIEKALSIYAPKDGSRTIKKHHYNMQHPHARSMRKHMSQTNRPCLLCHAQLLFTTMYVMCCVHIFLFGLSSLFLIPQMALFPSSFCTNADLVPSAVAELSASHQGLDTSILHTQTMAGEEGGRPSHLLPEHMCA
jgi:hypothetical protein